MRKIVFFVATIGVIALLGLGSTVSRTPARPANNLPPTVALGDTPVTLEILRTEPEKELGLGGRASIADQNGLFFWNESDGFPAIWMKDMRFPIDILWLAHDGRIVDLKPDAAPDSYPQIFVPRTSARYVIEVRAGFARDHHVNIGDSVALPRAVY